MTDYIVDPRATARPEKLRQARARERAEIALKIHAKKIPHLTPAQSEAIVMMLIEAEETGRQIILQEWFDHEEHEKKKRSSQAVWTRQRIANEKRAKFLQAFEAAAAQGGDLSVEKIAAKCGISKATAHRYLKQPKVRLQSGFRPARRPKK